MERYLQGRQGVDLTDALRAAGWPSAAEQLMEVLAISADPDQQFTVELGQMLIVDAQGVVTYMHPVFLQRTGSRAGQEAKLQPDAGEKAGT